MMRYDSIDTPLSNGIFCVCAWTGPSPAYLGTGFCKLLYVSHTLRALPDSETKFARARTRLKVGRLTSADEEQTKKNNLFFVVHFVFGISDRTNQKKGLLYTLLQLFKIGKIHPAKLLLNSQSIQGLNLLALRHKNPQQLNNALEELISLTLETKITPKANHEFSFNEIAAAHQGVEEGKFTGKVFVKV